MTATHAGAASMRVARYYSNRSIQVETMPRPAIRDGEVLVRVMACGICASDALEWFRLPRSPRILGHEISGVVAQSRSDRYREGDRVAVRHEVPCQRCYPCRQGHPAVCEEQAEIEPAGMADYIRVPAPVVESGLWPLPPRLSFPAATLAEPLACTMHAQRLARVRPHQCLVVLGCGPFGLLHLQLARATGLTRVVAVDGVESRRRVAARLGAALTMPPDASDASDASDAPVAEAVRRLNDGRLADVVVVATGSARALPLASTVVARYGTILLFGAPDPAAVLPLSLNQLFWRRELTVVSSYGAGDVDFSRPLELLDSGAVDSAALITHVLPLSQVGQGFELVATAKESLKVVLDLAS